MKETERKPSFLQGEDIERLHPSALKIERSCIKQSAGLLSCYHVHQGGCSLVGVGIENLPWLPTLTDCAMSLATWFSKHFERLLPGRHHAECQAYNTEEKTVR